MTQPTTPASKPRRRRGKGSITQLPSGNWNATYWRNGQRTSETKTTLREAENWLAGELKKKSAGGYVLRRNVRVKQLVDEYLKHCAAQGKTENTVRGYRSSLRAVCLLVGDTRVVDITPGRLTRLAAEMAELQEHERGPERVLAAQTRLNRLNALTALCQYAQDLEYVPAASLRFERPSREKNKPESYSDEDVEALLIAAEELGSRHLVGILLGVDAGFRLSEMLRFERDDIDAVRLTIHIPKTKNHKARTLPATQRLVEAVKAVGAKRGERVVARPTWRRTTPLYRMLRKVWVSADLDGGVHPHWLRHYWASKLANDPIDPATPFELMVWGGWGTLQQVMPYFHVPIQQRRGPIDRLSR